MERIMQQLTIAVGQIVENQNRVAEMQNQFLTWMTVECGVGGGGFKGEGKGGGYQGTCFKCGKVGHKAAECRVGEMGPEDEKPIGEVRNEGNSWVVVAGMTETLKWRRYKEGGLGRGEGKNADDAGSLDAEEGLDAEG